MRWLTGRGRPQEMRATGKSGPRVRSTSHSLEISSSVQLLTRGPAHAKDNDVSGRHRPILHPLSPQRGQVSAQPGRAPTRKPQKPRRAANPSRVGAAPALFTPSRVPRQPRLNAGGKSNHRGRQRPAPTTSPGGSTRFYGKQACSFHGFPGRRAFRRKGQGKKPRPTAVPGPRGPRPRHRRKTHRAGASSTPTARASNQMGHALKRRIHHGTPHRYHRWNGGPSPGGTADRTKRDTGRPSDSRFHTTRANTCLPHRPGTAAATSRTDTRPHAERLGPRPDGSRRGWPQATGWTATSAVLPIRSGEKLWFLNLVIVHFIRASLYRSAGCPASHPGRGIPAAPRPYASQHAAVDPKAASGPHARVVRGPGRSGSVRSAVLRCLLVANRPQCVTPTLGSCPAAQRQSSPDPVSSCRRRLQQIQFDEPWWPPPELETDRTRGFVRSGVAPTVMMAARCRTQSGPVYGARRTQAGRRIGVATGHVGGGLGGGPTFPERPSTKRHGDASAPTSTPRKANHSSD